MSPTLTLLPCPNCQEDVAWFRDARTCGMKAIQPAPSTAGYCRIDVDSGNDAWPGPWVAILSRQQVTAAVASDENLLLYKLHRCRGVAS